MRAGFIVSVLPLLFSLYVQSQPSGRVRARDLGIAPGVWPPGPLNAVTDVAGVRVGHTTIVQGDNVRTGVTAILAHGGNLFQEKVPGAVFVGNAFGKLAGSTQVQELGTIETPIVLTNTLAVGTAVEAVVAWTIAQRGNQEVRSVNALVGETNDGMLNDIRGLHVTREHVTAAIAGAKDGAVEEGAVGAGTGTVAFGWKGGIGRAPVGIELGKYYLRDQVRPASGAERRNGGTAVGLQRVQPTAVPSDRLAALDDSPDGSCMIVVATDAPLDARDLRRLAARAVFALARTGSSYSNGSGDFAIAFSTHPSLRVTNASGPQPRTLLPTDNLSGLFEAVLEATEEAVDNSLLKATDVTANGRTVRAIPIDALRDVMKKYGR
ncbi:MAG: aminopeptidase [Acidobacteria bacterium]|nr:MAG: aminopeptidase [Acidobacteriota bacterium]